MFATTQPDRDLASLQAHVQPSLDLFKTRAYYGEREVCVQIRKREEEKEGIAALGVGATSPIDYSTPTPLKKITGQHERNSQPKLFFTAEKQRSAEDSDTPCTQLNSA